MTVREQTRYQLRDSLLVKHAVLMVGALTIGAPVVAASQPESWFSRLTWSAHTDANKTTFGPDLTSFVAISEPVTLSAVNLADSGQSGDVQSDSDGSAASVRLEVAYFPAFSCSARIGLAMEGMSDASLSQQMLASDVPVEVSVDGEALDFPYLAEDMGDGSTTVKLYLDADLELRAAAQILIELGNRMTVQIADQTAQLSLRGSRDTISQAVSRCENAAAE